VYSYGLRTSSFSSYSLPLLPTEQHHRIHSVKVPRFVSTMSLHSHRLRLSHHRRCISSPDCPQMCKINIFDFEIFEAILHIETSTSIRGGKINFCPIFICVKYSLFHESLAETATLVCWQNMHVGQICELSAFASRKATSRVSHLTIHGRSIIVLLRKLPRRRKEALSER
jgi:hypothetical protein